MENNDKVNLLTYIDVLKKHKWLILIIVTVSVVATGIVSFLTPNIYVSRAVIMPAAPSTGQSGMGAIAMQLGIPTPTTSNTSEILNLFRSNILMERVIKRYNLTSVFFGKNPKKKPTTNKIWDSIRYLKGIFKVEHNQIGDSIELSVEFRDPKIAAEIINYILTELTDYMSSEAKRVAETNRKYLESLIDKNPDPLIRQKIYYLIAQQIETSMMAEVKENFAFKMIDPPKVPDRKIKPKRRENVIFSFVISLFAGVFLTFFIEYIENIKKREKKTAGSTQ